MNAVWENLDTFLDTDDFSIQAALRLQSGQTRRVRAIFDEPYLNAELGEYELDTNQPRLTCKWKDVQDVAQGDVVEVGGRPHDVVTNAQPDGTGMALLALVVQQQWLICIATKRVCSVQLKSWVQPMRRFCRRCAARSATWRAGRVRARCGNWPEALSFLRRFCDPGSRRSDCGARQRGLRQTSGMVLTRWH